MTFRPEGKVDALIAGDRSFVLRCALCDQHIAFVGYLDEDGFADEAVGTLLFRMMRTHREGGDCHPKGSGREPTNWAKLVGHKLATVSKVGELDEAAAEYFEKQEEDAGGYPHTLS